jgi:hypothetical protein
MEQDEGGTSTAPTAEGELIGLDGDIGTDDNRVSSRLQGQPGVFLI